MVRGLPSPTGRVNMLHGTASSATHPSSTIRAAACHSPSHSSFAARPPAISAYCVPRALTFSSLSSSPRLLLNGFSRKRTRSSPRYHTPRRVSRATMRWGSESLQWNAT